MNKAEIRQELLDLMGEASPMMVIQEESIEDALQFAQDEIAVKLGLTYVETEEIPVDDEGIAVLPDSLVKPIRIWYDPTPLEPPQPPIAVSAYIGYLNFRSPWVAMADIGWGSPAEDLDPSRYQMWSDLGNTPVDWSDIAFIMTPSDATMSIPAGQIVPIKNWFDASQTGNTCDISHYFSIDMLTHAPGFPLNPGEVYARVKTTSDDNTLGYYESDVYVDFDILASTPRDSVVVRVRYQGNFF